MSARIISSLTVSPYCVEADEPPDRDGTFPGRTSDDVTHESVLSLYFQVRSFVSIHDGLDENYVIYSEFEENGRFKIKLFCVNPAEKSAEISGLRKRHRVFFCNTSSDTLL